jgi:hypothetical protein
VSASSTAGIFRQEPAKKHPNESERLAAGHGNRGVQLQCCNAALPGLRVGRKRAALPWRVWQSGNLLLVGQLLGRRICTALCSEPPAAMSQHAQNQGRTRQIGPPRRGAIKQAKQPGNGAVLSDKGAAVRDLLCDKAREGNPSSSSASPCPLTLPLAVLPRRAAGP